MRYLIFGFLLLLYLPIRGEITLEDAVQRGLKQHEVLKNCRLDESLSDLKLSSARMKKWFSLDTGGSYRYTSEQIEISIPVTGLSGIPGGAGQTISGTNHNYDLYLGLNQPLFTGGVLSNMVKQREVEYQLAQIRSDAERLTLIKEIKSSFFNYQIIRYQEKNLSVTQEKMMLHLKKINNLYQEDLVRKSDILETRKSIEEIRLRISQMDHLMNSEKERFMRLTGIDPSVVDQGSSGKLLSFSEAGIYFEKKHPMMKVYNQRIHALNLQKKIILGMRLPQISAVSQVHYGKPGIDFFKNEWTLYFQGGIQVSFPVFRWNQLHRDQKMVDVMIDKVINEQLDFKKNVTRQLKIAYQAMESLESQLEHLKLLIKYSQEDEGIKKRLFDERQISNIDYLAAVTNQQRYQYQKDEISARMELVKLSIDFLIGKSKEER